MRRKLLEWAAGAMGFDVVLTRRRSRNKSSYKWAHISFDPNRVPDAAYGRLYSADSLEGRRFYNIGAGTFRHKYWTNVDMPSDWYADAQQDWPMIAYDLEAIEPLPIPSGTAECVYVSHTFEHVSDAAAANAMREAFRILKPGGVFRVTGPDVSLDIAAWRRGDRDHFYYLDLISHDDVIDGVKLNRDYRAKDASFEQLILFCVASSTSRVVSDESARKISDEEVRNMFAKLGDEGALNAICSYADLDLQRQNLGWHVSWWSVDKAVRMMREAGFDNPHKSGYGQSLATVMSDVAHFDKQDPKLSFYVEAVKQG